jgi:hypothetical protein
MLVFKRRRDDDGQLLKAGFFRNAECSTLGYVDAAAGRTRRDCRLCIVLRHDGSAKANGRCRGLPDREWEIQTP